MSLKGIFSITGLILNSKKSHSMASYRAKLLSFVHDNYAKYYSTFPLKDAEEAKSRTSHNLAYDSDAYEKIKLRTLHGLNSDSDAKSK